MELLFVFVLTLIAGIASCYVLGNLYSLCRRPAVYFPLLLAAKMSSVCLLGIALGGFGGIVLGTLVFNRAFRLRSDYNVVGCVIAGSVISAAVCLIMVFSGYLLAWEIIG